MKILELYPMVKMCNGQEVCFLFVSSLRSFSVFQKHNRRLDVLQRLGVATHLGQNNAYVDVRSRWISAFRDLLFNRQSFQKALQNLVVIVAKFEEEH